MIHSSPTVVDLDGDGRMEVIVGTSLGLLYVLDADTGFARRHFPMQVVSFLHDIISHFKIVLVSFMNCRVR